MNGFSRLALELLALHSRGDRYHFYSNRSGSVIQVDYPRSSGLLSWRGFMSWSRGETGASDRETPVRPRAVSRVVRCFGRLPTRHHDERKTREGKLEREVEEIRHEVLELVSDISGNPIEEIIFAKHRHREKS